MLIFSYVIMYIISNKNKYCINCFICYFSLYNKKVKKQFTEFVFESISNIYIYHLSKHMTNLRFTFYESLQAQMLNLKNKNTNLYNKLYILFIRNKKRPKNRLPNKYFFYCFHP
jgi:hypothetical protein